MMSNPDEWQSRMAGEYSGIGFDQDVAGGKTWKINTQLRLNDPRLVKLNVGYNTVGAEGALLLAQGLRYNTTLISCVAAGIDAGDRGAASFGAALTTNRTLVSLDLGLNDIAEEGAHKLGRGLAQNATLTHLSLAGNELQERGVRNLAPHLARHASLTALDLRANDSKPAAAIALAEALAGRNTMLTSLDLRANRLGSTGTMALLACVAQNGVLRRLDLCENGLMALPEPFGGLTALWRLDLHSKVAQRFFEAAFFTVGGWARKFCFSQQWGPKNNCLGLERCFPLLWSSSCGR